MSMFFVLIMFLGWFASYYFGNALIFYFALAFSVIMPIISYWNSASIVLKISGAKPASKEEYYDLYTLTENLSITAGLPMPKIYVMHDPVPNAFATGRNKEHGVVAVTTGLLEILDRTELEGVIAHELAHIGNRDILLQTVVVVLVGLVTLLADLFIRATFFGGSDNKGGKAGGILLIIGIILMILSPIIATIIQLMISRKREYLADATGALLTRYPEGLASALEKISGYSGGRKMKKANHATAHMFFASPFGEHSKKHKGFMNSLFSTHPPVEKRIENLRGIEIK
ncbi:M48 family metallopeptidase [Candidatus Parcubacteria bacterium]|nr:M48 family metallopeptidase [Candidatus Parcubacteria bacterium]